MSTVVRRELIRLEGDEVSGTEELVSGVSMAMAEGESRLFDVFSTLVHVVVIAVVPLPRDPVIVFTGSLGIV